ncbi:OX2R-like protein [Mya arenaria]|uniref:OX2R-like protein n=1 Tax=Mya arenaria TaxID=6604 RepID=A0ABY7FTP9_MYAAR|nr:OX2R-like protein [Mya arenaria]
MVENVSTNSSNVTRDYEYTDDQIMEFVWEHITLKYYHWIFISLFFLVFVVGSAGNFLVCFSVWRSKSLRNATNYFLVNRAVSDFLVIVLCLPATIMLDALHSWFLGLAMCKVFIYMQSAVSEVVQI